MDTKDRTKQKACLERYRKACIEILAVLHKAAPQVCYSLAGFMHWITKRVEHCHAVIRLINFACLQAVIEKASIDEVYMDVTTMVERELRVSPNTQPCY